MCIFQYIIVFAIAVNLQCLKNECSAQEAERCNVLRIWSLCVHSEPHGCSCRASCRALPAPVALLQCHAITSTPSRSCASQLLKGSKPSLHYSHQQNTNKTSLVFFSFIICIFAKCFLRALACLVWGRMSCCSFSFLSIFLCRLLIQDYKLTE